MLVDLLQLTVALPSVDDCHTRERHYDVVDLHP